MNKYEHYLTKKYVDMILCYLGDLIMSLPEKDIHKLIDWPFNNNGHISIARCFLNKITG